MDILDITPHERGILSQLRHNPALYLGRVSLRDFFHMSSGYKFAMETAQQREWHNLLRAGLNEFRDRWSRGDKGTRNWYSMIDLHEPDDAAALGVFFEILDAYIRELGFAPIPAYVENCR